MVAVVGGALLTMAFVPVEARPRREITLTAQSVALSATQPELDRVGGLRFKGGLSLESRDPGFGGLSGLALEDRSGELQMVAVSDQGETLHARLLVGEGQLRGLDRVTLEPLLDTRGEPVKGKSFSDAESLARLPDGRILVGFERRHRIWSYGASLEGRAVVFDTPKALEKAPSNGGVESVASWPDGRVLAISEGLRGRSGNVAAFLLHQGSWAALEWVPSDSGFEPADATVLPNGDLLVLERSFSARFPAALSSRIQRVRSDSVKPGAQLRGELVAELTAPLVAENFEGIAVVKSAAGTTQLALVSDNNFNSFQRTLLLWFEML